VIRVGLYSQDATLQPLLASALGNEFRFFFDSSEIGIRRVLIDQDCHALIVDLNSSSVDLKERLECACRLIASRIPLIVLADDALRVTADELVRRGAFGYCRRPPSVRDLRAMLRRLYESTAQIQSSDLQTANDTSGPRDRMVGSSEAMRRVHQLVDCVAHIDASVLVAGESGTGKELVARAIHSRGSRANKPFVAVACGAIPETLIEAELFGHEKGAFTGSTGAREGFFEQAADGTLFLDEIGELSPYTQVKLLRVLQQREFSRLGSNKLIPLRARLVFATHRDLNEMVGEGKFRQDLYYRINVMKIDTPPLQEHVDDIPQIAMHFLHRYAQQFHKNVTEIAPEAISMLQNYSWPGNVRELENVIQRAIIMTQGQTIRAEDLPPNLQEEVAIQEEATIGGSFERQLREYKVRLAETAIRENNGNKTLAARSLHISRAYLHRLIRQPEPGSFLEQESGASLQRYN
jgi:DNA-binding NtrC family response regulator